ncbi:replicative DNA helicase [Corynebacteriaceae bacterium 7-707]
MTDEIPNAAASERALLGAMLSNRHVVAAAADRIRAEDFFVPAHATIFNAILTTWADGVDSDPVAVVGCLEDQGQLEHVGGHLAVSDLYSSAAPADSVTWHVRRVTESAVLRRLQAAGTTITQIATTSTPAGASAAVAQAQAAMAEVPASEQTHTQAVSDVLEDVMDDLESPTGGEPIPTGFYDLDRLTNGGLRPGQLVIAGARPGQGKTTLALDLLRHAALRERKPALMFSLEMSNREVTQRILSAESQVPFVKMQRRELVPSDWDAMTRAVGPIEGAPLIVNDDPATTMVTIQATARRLAQQHDLGLIVVDYLQLLTSGTKSESRQQEVSGFSRQLKLLAKDLEVPVVAAAQLNRGVESRGDDATPRLSDLRESGSIEQDADIVMFIHRPDQKDPDGKRGGEADIIVAKHRGGSTGTVTVTNRLDVCRFDNFAR